MNSRFRMLLLLASLAAAGCAGAPQDETMDKATDSAGAESATAPGVEPQQQLEQAELKRPARPAAKPELNAMSFGRGVARADGLDVTFMFNVSLQVDDVATGTFAQSASGPAGTIDIEANAVCASFDSDAGQGWIGGEVKRNGSTDPRFAGEPGSDVWFRVLDRNRNQQQPMISIVAFREKGIDDASSFCDQARWSEDGLHLVETGALGIFVRPQ